jgi:hypothetical protein
LTRVLSEGELREILNLLIPIIRGEGPYKIDQLKHAESVIDSNKDKARKVWRLLTYEDYDGEVVE